MFKSIFKTRYAVWRLYPAGKCNSGMYTSSYHLYFPFRWLAVLTVRILKAWDSFAAGEYLSYYSARISRVVEYGVDNYELPIEYADSGAWRSYTLDAAGDTLEELLKDATISEIDQDGGTLNCYGIEYGNEATELAEEYLTKLVQK